MNNADRDLKLIDGGVSDDAAHGAAGSKKRRTGRTGRAGFSRIQPSVGGQVPDEIRVGDGQASETDQRRLSRSDHGGGDAGKEEAEPGIARPDNR